MKLIISAVYDIKTQMMDVSVESEMMEDETDENGNAISIVRSPELAYLELIRDIAMGLIDPRTRGFWDRPINLIEEYEAYHQSAANDISRGKYGPNVSSSSVG